MALVGENFQTDEISLKPLTKRLGSSLEGIDCRHVDDVTWATIIDVFHDRNLLVFPNQNLNPDEHTAFMERFGELDVHPQGKPRAFQVSDRQRLATNPNKEIGFSSQDLQFVHLHRQTDKAKVRVFLDN